MDRTSLLEGQLAQAQRKIDALQGLTTPKECFFLRRLPIELRNQIYGLLLVNSDLSSSQSLDRRRRLPDEPYLEKQFGLSPAILRTCRQIYDEASDTLYGNIIIIDCITRDIIRSPVLRHVAPGGEKLDLVEGRLLFNYPAVKKLKSWKVLLGANKREEFGYPSGAFLHLCQAIADTPHRSLQVGIVPRGVRFEGRPTLHPRSLPKYNDIDVVLSPLQILRNLKKLTITQAWFDDLQVLDATSDASQVTPHELPEDLLAQLKYDTRGSQPVVHVFKMYQNLATYAQVFERNDIFRAEMNPEWGTAWNRQLVESRRHYADIGSYPYSQIYGSQSLFKPDGKAHPIEKNLELASISSDKNDYDGFKIARRDVLYSLEAQYQRIKSSARVIADYVKELKKTNYLLSPTGIGRHPGVPMICEMLDR